MITAKHFTNDPTRKSPCGSIVRLPLAPNQENEFPLKGKFFCCDAAGETWEEVMRQINANHGIVVKSIKVVTK